MKSVLKTLSLSFVVLSAAAMASASPQGPLRHPAMASEPAGSAPSLSEIDEGWARLLDAALAKRAPGEPRRSGRHRHSAVQEFRPLS